VGDRGIEIGEEVIFVREPIEHTDVSQEFEVRSARTLEEHRDTARFKLLDDLTERLRAGRVEHLQTG
jgi:hypothetical protein